MICRLSYEEAQAWFKQLPLARQLATLSPDYVVADAARNSELIPIFFGYRVGRLFWLHGIHRSLFLPNNIIDQQSPNGYGGPISNSDDIEFAGAAWNSYEQACRNEDVLAEFVRLHPVAAPWQSYGGTIRTDRDTVLINTCGDYRSRYSVRCRTAVRKAEKAGLTVREETGDLIAGRFADFYRQGMRAIGAHPFYLFSDDYFGALKQCMGIRLLVCEKGGAWLSAGLFLTGGDTMEYHLSSTTDEGRKLSATNLLLDQAARLAHDMGLSTLYLGGGTDNSPKNQLLFFKKGFSEQSLPFRTGSAIFQHRRYELLKAEYERNGKLGSRTLFYRA